MNTRLQTKTAPFTPTEDEVIRQMKEDIAAGRHWYIALLEAIGRWQLAEEVVDGAQG